MRICIFTPNFLPAVGGTEAVTDALARQFQAKGHETWVLAQGREVGLDVPYPVRWFGKPFLPRVRPERVGGALAALHREERFDIFVANYAHPTGYAALRVGERVGVPTVIISHGGDLYRTSEDRARPVVWKRTQYAYRHADGLVAISPYIEELIREIHPDPRVLERIPNGVDIEALNEHADRPVDFDDDLGFALCLGNLGPMKGFADAIDAYARVADPGLTLVVVGTGKLDGPLKERAAGLGLGDRVRFMGKRVGNDKRWFLQNCRYGLMPSIEEGHPLVGLEYLAVGKPLVCSTNAAFDGMFEDGVNAIRVPAQRADLLAGAMREMGQADLAAMGLASRRRADGYTWSAVADRYLRVFGRVLGTDGGGEPGGTSEGEVALRAVT